MRSRYLVVPALLVGALCLGMPAAGQQGRAGHFLDVRGAVRLVRGGEERTPFFLSPLREGDVVRLARKEIGDTPSEAQVMLDATGRRVFLLAGSICRVENGRIVTVNNVATRDHPRVLERLARLPRQGRGMAGGASRASLQWDVARPPTPCGGLRTAPAEIRWDCLPEGAVKSLEVLLEVRLRQGTAAAAGPPLLAKKLDPETRRFLLDGVRLEADREYEWSLHELTPEGKAQTLFTRPFRILTRSELETLAEVEQFPAGAGSADQLVRATTYDRLDLFTEAARAYGGVLKAAPGQPLVQAALERVEKAHLGVPPPAPRAEEP